MTTVSLDFFNFNQLLQNDVLLILILNLTEQSRDVVTHFCLSDQKQALTV
jgi:hypothetical protein